MNMIREGLYMVEFSAPWCAIRETRSYFEHQAEDHHIQFLHCDVDDNPQIASGLGVFSVPTWVLFKDGSEVDRFLGRDATKKFTEVVSHLDD